VAAGGEPLASDAPKPKPDDGDAAPEATSEVSDASPAPKPEEAADGEEPKPDETVQAVADPEAGA
jgi:hypothetical protein